MIRHALRPLILALLALAPVVTASAADNSTAATAARLASSQAGSLAGGPGGHFAFYSFAYPAGWPMTIELTPHTTDQTILRYAGFKVYGPRPNHEYVDGRVDETGVFHGTRVLNSQDRGLYLIQVYHYHPNPETTLNYTLRIKDLPDQPNVDEPVPGPTQGESGHFAVPLSGTETGSLEGNTGGSFRYYAFELRANTTTHFRMQIEPGDAGTLSRAGFKVYGPSPNKEYLQSEADPTMRPNLRGSLWVTESGTYVVQVYNYNPRTEVRYSLWREP